MVVRDLWERDFFKAFPTFLVILALVLAQLAAPIGAKTVKMARVRQRHRVSLSTRDRNYFLVA